MTRTMACLWLLIPLLLAKALAAEPSPAWSPLRIAPMELREAEKLKEEAATHRAELGYLYAIPAFLHLRQRYQFAYNTITYQKIDNPFGRFFVVRQPAGPETQDTMPNQDTLYGATFLDLDFGPYVLSVPSIRDRYYAFNFIDAYFYNFDFVSSRTDGAAAGDYLIVGPTWTGIAPAGTRRVVRAPTRWINVYQRIHFRDAMDIANVHRLQDSIQLRSLTVHLDKTVVAAQPDPKEVLKVNPLSVTNPREMLAMANAYMTVNPPPIEDRALVDSFKSVGIGPGASLPTDAAGIDVIMKGAEQAQKTIASLYLTALETRHGWQLPRTDMGVRGGESAVPLHAMTQIRSIGYNAAKEAVYYLALADQRGEALTPGNRYVLKFEKDQIPPLARNTPGFWSLVAYDSERFGFVKNDTGKYVIRSSDRLVYDKDGALTLHVQKEPPADPARLPNWLPAPDRPQFVMMLRVFQGDDTVVAGRYAPPGIVKVRRSLD